MFEKWTQGDTKKQKYMLLAIVIAIVGIAITFIPFGKGASGKDGVQKVQTVAQGNTTSLSYEQQLEKRLVTILQKMNGAGAVSVMITVTSNEEKVLAEDVTSSTSNDQQQDQAGGTRHTTSQSTNQKVVLQSGNTPYVVKENKPEIQGVLILAEGASDSIVKSEITDAVSKLLGVPVHKISVLKKQQ